MTCHFTILLLKWINHSRIRLSLCQRHTCRPGDTDLNWVLHYSKTYRVGRAKKCQSGERRKMCGGDTLTQYPAQQARILTYKWNRQRTRDLINMEILSARKSHGDPLFATFLLFTEARTTPSGNVLNYSRNSIRCIVRLRKDFIEIRINCIREACN